MSMLDMLWGGVRLVTEVCMMRGRIMASDTQRVLGRCGKCRTAASALAMSARGMCCRLHIDLLLPIVTCISQSLIVCTRGSFIRDFLTVCRIYTITDCTSLSQPGGLHHTLPLNAFSMDSGIFALTCIVLQAMFATYTISLHHIQPCGFTLSRASNPQPTESRF
jgi:hypothetical protein